MFSKAPVWFDASGGGVRLIPGWDMINHDSVPNCDWENEISSDDHKKVRFFCYSYKLGFIKKNSQIYTNKNRIASCR